MNQPKKRSAQFGRGVFQYLRLTLQNRIAFITHQTSIIRQNLGDFTYLETFSTQFFLVSPQFKFVSPQENLVAPQI